MYFLLHLLFLQAIKDFYFLVFKPPSSFLELLHLQIETSLLRVCKPPLCLLREGYSPSCQEPEGFQVKAHIAAETGAEQSWDVTDIGRLPPQRRLGPKRR